MLGCRSLSRFHENQNSASYTSTAKRKLDTSAARSILASGFKHRGTHQAKPPGQWLICWVKRGQPPPVWSVKSRPPPSRADSPEKITQLQGQFYRGLSSFPAELNKRWRVYSNDWGISYSGLVTHLGLERIQGFSLLTGLYFKQCFLLTILVFISSGFHWVKLEA